MKVLYVSKALVVAAYRDKIRDLSRHLEMLTVVPDRWPPGGVERANGGDPRLRFQSVWLAGRPHGHLYRGIGRVIREFRPDLIHVDEEPYSAVTFQLVRQGERAGVPAVCFAWQNVRKTLPPPFGMMQGYVLRNVAGVIAGTEGAGRLLVSRGFAGPLAVIPQFGVDPERYQTRVEDRRRLRAEIGAGDGELVVGFAGRLVPEKGVDVLIRASAAAGWKSVVVGEGRDRARLESVARDLGAGNTCRFAGRIESAALPAWLAAFDALALPSLTTSGWVEQFGRILIEAMAAGLPVIGSDSGEIPHVIGDAGVVVAEGSVSALAAALERLARAPDERAALGRRGRDRVLERFTSERVARETAAFYHELLGRPA